MSPKLIFLDIDGTLTMPGSNEPPQSALDAIRASQRKGNLVFLCSGRNPGMLEPLLKYGFDGVIACAGGYVTVGDELIYDMPMAGEEMELAVEKLHGEGVFCTIECKDGAFGDENLGAFLDKHAGEDGKGAGARRWQAVSISARSANMTERRPTKSSSCACTPSSSSLQRRPWRTKGRAIERVCAHLGVPISDAYGFGDSMNDLEMIQTVGTSVCMANGAEALKKISDVVCPSVEEDGLAKAFEQLGLV